MNAVSRIFQDTTNAIVTRRLKNAGQRQLLVSTLMAGFAGLRKKAVPDEVRRTQVLEQRVIRLAENVAVDFIGDRLLCRAARDGEQLLKELRYGSDWYAPWAAVDEVVLAAILAEPPK